MSFDDYKVVLYRNQPGGWVAEVPAIPGCYALMPAREEALVELAAIFRLISKSTRNGISLYPPTQPKCAGKRLTYKHLIGRAKYLS